MSEDLTALGNDGIRRSFDEHYGTMMDVEQDPTGAMWAIHKQVDRIEELEANINIKADFIDATINQLAASDQRIEELEAKLAELLAVAKRAVRLSLDHSDFKLYAMEPMHQAITAAELKGQKDE